MGDTEWSGDQGLVGAAERAFRPAASATAVAVVTPEGGMTARRGSDHHSTFEVGSISEGLTGMLHRHAAERDLVSPTTTLGDLLPLTGHLDVGAVTLGSLAVHRSGLPGLPPGMHPLRRSLGLWIRGENPYGDSLATLLVQVRTVHVGAPRPRYSNLGFQLLGHAVAAAAGSSYPQLLQDDLGPGFSTPARVEDLGPADLTGRDRFGRPMQPWVGEAIAPAGGIRATIGTSLRPVRRRRPSSMTSPPADPPVREGIGSRTMHS